MPNDNEEILSIFQDFLLTKEKEMSFISVTPFFIDDIYNSEKNEFGEDTISFSYSGRSYLDIFDKVKRGELRVYYNPTNIPIPIPIVSKIQEISMFENEETEVRIDGEVFYKSVTRVRKSVYDVVIQFGDSFSLIVNSDENIGTLEINMSKKLRSINSDYNFLIAFSKNFTLADFIMKLATSKSP